MLSLDEIIKHVEQVAYSNDDKALVCMGIKEYRELAELLRELQDRRKAPEIVFCKDCIYYNWDCVDAPYGMTKTICWCDLHYDAVNDNLAANPYDFCSRAVRRTDGQK